VTPTCSPTQSVTGTITPTFSFSPTISQTFTITPTFSSSPTPEIPASLSHNVYRPNKGGTLDVNFRPGMDGKVIVKVFTLSGELVQPVFETDVVAGTWYQAKWDGRNANGEMVASGVYFVSIQGAGIRNIRKVIVLK
jgi:hypothetical protein